ncbi:hypothetical protein ACQY1Q_02895 [Tenacibaculum sp. TC6]|uniref:hypothetical protein n=1 Tax=Tenacibaculum sp. TC6 TaxID=3423223 RepID=UPI003D36C8BE
MIYTIEKPQKSQDLKKQFLDQLKYFISKNKMPDNIKGLITDEKFIKENPSYYTYYPHLFNTVFKVTNVEILNTLTLAGFLYYKAVMVIDEMFDDKSKEKNFLGFLISDICKEEAIKLLSSLFSLEHQFWSSWNGRKFQYVKAYEIDKNPHKIISYEDYEELADYKCAFGKVAIDALYHISETNDLVEYSNLLSSHKFFYTAFQITDDITDFQEDIENEQFNIALFELEKKLGKEEVKQKSIGELKKILYLEGIINELYEKALTYLKKAKEYVEGYDLYEWKFEIQKLHNAIVKNQLNVKGFIDVFYIKNQLSNVLLETSETIKKASEKGKIFIKKEYDERKKCWQDYFNDAGISDVWTTGFVLSQDYWDIEDIDFLNEIKAISFLKSQEKETGLWGYNTKWIPDADSSTFVMRALTKHKKKISKETLELWCNFQNDDGGFSTYKNDEEVIISLNSETIVDVKGWMQSHFCVSAAAYLFLCEQGINNKSFQKLKNYLSKELEKKENIHSYWWTSNMYAFNLVYKGAIIEQDKKLLSLVLPHIWSFIEEEYIKIKETNNYFYLGLLLEVLSISNELKKYEMLREEISNLLLKNQFEDGSWKESEAMRIPYPSIINAGHPEIKWSVTDKGTNIIVKDFHRLFTTSACISGLRAYAKCIK